MFVAPRTENLRRRGALHASLFGLGQSPQMLPVGGLLLAPRHLVITTVAYPPYVRHGSEDGIWFLVIHPSESKKPMKMD